MLAVPDADFISNFFRLLQQCMPYATAGFNNALFDDPVLLAHAIADDRLGGLLEPQITVQELRSWLVSSRDHACAIRPGHVVHLTGYGVQWHFCFHRHNDKPCVKMHVGAAVYLDVYEFVRGVHETKSSQPSVEGHEESWSLDAVAHNSLGVQKLESDVAWFITSTWRPLSISPEEADKACAYNAVDSLLVDQYICQRRIVQLAVDVATQLRSQASSICSWRLGAVADCGLQLQHLESGLWPVEIGATILPGLYGGAVLECRPAVALDVSVGDWKSKYPTVCDQCNLGTFCISAFCSQDVMPQYSPE